MSAGVAEAIQVTDHHPETTTDHHPETATDCPLEVTDEAQPPTTTCTTTKTNFNTLQIDSSETPCIPKDNTLETDIAQDGQTMFFTTLHFKTNSSQATKWW